MCPCTKCEVSECLAFLVAAIRPAPPRGTARARMPGRGSLGSLQPELCSPRAVAGVGSSHQAGAGAVAIRVSGEGG